MKKKISVFAAMTDEEFALFLSRLSLDRAKELGRARAPHAPLRLVPLLRMPNPQRN